MKRERRIDNPYGFDPELPVLNGDPRLNPGLGLGTEWHLSQPVQNEWEDWAVSERPMFDFSKSAEVALNIDALSNQVTGELDDLSVGAPTVVDSSIVGYGTDDSGDKLTRSAADATDDPVTWNLLGLGHMYSGSIPVTASTTSVVTADPATPTPSIGGSGAGVGGGGAGAGVGGGAGFGRPPAISAPSGPAVAPSVPMYGEKSPALDAFLAEAVSVPSGSTPVGAPTDVVTELPPWSALGLGHAFTALPPAPTPPPTSSSPAVPARSPSASPPRGRTNGVVTAQGVVLPYGGVIGGGVGGAGAGDTTRFGAAGAAGATDTKNVGMFSAGLPMRATPPLPPPSSSGFVRASRSHADLVTLGSDAHNLRGSDSDEDMGSGRGTGRGPRPASASPSNRRVPKPSRGRGGRSRRGTGTTRKPAATATAAATAPSRAAGRAAKPRGTSNSAAIIQQKTAHRLRKNAYISSLGPEVDRLEGDLAAVEALAWGQGADGIRGLPVHALQYEGHPVSKDNPAQVKAASDRAFREVSASPAAVKSTLSSFQRPLTATLLRSRMLLLASGVKSPACPVAAAKRRSVLATSPIALEESSSIQELAAELRQELALTDAQMAAIRKTKHTLCRNLEGMRALRQLEAETLSAVSTGISESPEVLHALGTRVSITRMKKLVDFVSVRSGSLEDMLLKDQLKAVRTPAKTCC